MKLRLIFLVLSLLAFFSASAGGWLYYRSLKVAAFKEAEYNAVTRVEIIQKNLAAFLAENRKPVRALACLPAPARLLSRGLADDREAVNDLLDNFRRALAADVCYLMDARGYTVASSNRRAADSFVGKNFAFRPYFLEAMAAKTSSYLALGTTSHKRGIYCSHPVFGPDQERPLGIVVIKSSIEQIEKKLGQSRDEAVVVVDPQGLVFLSNRPQWLFHSLWPLTDVGRRQLTDSRQFGTGPWDWTGLENDGSGYARDQQGRRYLVNQLELEGFPGWQVIHLRGLREIYRVVVDPLVRVTLPVVSLICVMIAVAVFFLYRKASLEIFQRRLAEEALRRSEERYRSIYHKTPAMLHSINRQGRLVSVSDNWLEVMGYARDEVVGRDLMDFLAPESRRLASEKIMPEFFRTGICKDVPYRFIRRDGSLMDVLLSAIGDRDAEGRVVRSLAVTIDISARKQAEEALRQAQAALRLQASDLERQVKERTAEIRHAQDQLRRLSAGIMAGQEKERAAIARGLHDELGQVLTALRLEAVWLSERLSGLDDKAAQRAATMTSLIDETIDEVRSIALRLRPGILDDLGLVEALEWFAADFERRTGIACALVVEGEVPVFEAYLATAAYRIVQEALTNVARHAEADQVNLSLRVADGMIEIIIEDNGQGFADSELSEGSGLGLPGMRERAALIGGHLTVKARPGDGVRIVFQAPLSWEEV